MTVDTPNTSIATSSYSPSPMRSSPLSNPPVFSPSRSPSTSPERITSLSHHGRTKPRAIPAERRRSTLAQMTPSRPSPPLSSATLITPSSSSTSSPPLSRSQPLLGSYSLSLLHSRMSHAHTPHSLSPTPTSGFSLHLGALGKGKSCPPELRCPRHENIPFQATYYDIQDIGRGATQTPWVGTVDLEQHYFSQYSSPSISTSSSRPEASTSSTPLPPHYPGYRVAPFGQLQILVKTAKSAVKVFLVPYDLRRLPVGGRLLAREKTFADSPAQAGPSSSPSNSKGALRYSIQLQFICVPATVEPSGSRIRQSSTTRKARVGGAMVIAPQSGSDEAHAQIMATDKAYYVSKSIKVIFASSVSDHEQQRSEREDELILPSDSPASSSMDRGRSVLSPSSFGRRDEWDLIRQKWLAKKRVAEEMEDLTTSTSSLSSAGQPGPEGSPPLKKTVLPERGFSPERPSSPVRSFSPLLGMRSSSPSSPLGSPTGSQLHLPLLSQLSSSRPATPPLSASQELVRDETGSKSLEMDESGGIFGVRSGILSLKHPNSHNRRSRGGKRRGSASREERELSEKLRNGLEVNDH